MRSKKAVKNITVITCLIMIFCCIAGTVAASWYTVNQSDDYQHAMEIGKFHEGVFAYTITSLTYMARMYMNWAGNYTSMFLQSLLSPLNNGGAFQLRFVMVFNALLFFSVFFTLVAIYIKHIFEIDSATIFIILSLIVFPFMNYRCYYEIFYWFSGAVSYSFPLSALFLSFILILLSYKGKRFRTGLYILSLIFALLGAGGSLTLAGVGCYVSFLALVYVRLFSKRFDLRVGGLFITVLAGTLINVIAPGNYVRAAETDNNISLYSTVINTIKSAYSEYRWLFHDTSFLVIIMIAVIIGMICKDHFKADKKAYYTISIAALLTPLISIFPVIMGYGINFLANRTLFVIELTMYLSTVNAALCLGMLVSEIMGKESIKYMGAILASSSIVFLCLSDYSLKDMAAVRTVLNDANGTFSSYYNECAKMEQYFSGCSGMDVVIKPDQIPIGPNDFSCFYLENSWVNEGIASYYGMRSLYLDE